MPSQISDLAARVEEIAQPRLTGRVREIVGLRLTAAGLDRQLSIGARCRIHGRGGPVMGEVVGVDARGTHLLPFGDWGGVRRGDAVQALPRNTGISPGPGWIGRTVNALGQPVDGKGPLPAGRVQRGFRALAPSAFDRRAVGRRIETGVRVLDVFAPVCRGQRMGIFAGSGVGKSTMLASLARRADADVIVVGLVGERGREVRDFIEETLGPEGMARSVLVVATSDEAPLMRRQAALTATAVAESFRDAGQHVLLMLDSVTRFAHAHREIGLSLGEPPTARGYPPTVFSELPKLLERTGPGCEGQGDITALYTVLMDGDDLNDPIVDAVRGVLDGHIVLSRQVAEKGRYPAVDLQKSLSRMLPDCHSEAENAILAGARRAAAKFEQIEELLQIGAYKAGTDPEIDAAIRIAGALEELMHQPKGSAVTSAEAFQATQAVLEREGWL
jgi:flagellum-specific ATP synthase